MGGGCQRRTRKISRRKRRRSTDVNAKRMGGVDSVYRLKTMITRDEALQLLLKTHEYLAKLRTEQPDNSELRDAKIYLDSLEDEFYKGWPLEDTDKASALGEYVGRQLFDGPYGDLVEMMAKLAFKMGGGH